YSPAMRLLCALLLAGCGATARPGAPPSAAAQAWSAAHRADDPRAAYDLLAEAVRGRKSYEEFRAEEQQARVERGGQVKALEGRVREGAQAGGRAELRPPPGESAQPAELVHEAEGWRLERPLAATTRAGTPEDALRLFATAIEERSFTG